MYIVSLIPKTTLPKTLFGIELKSTTEQKDLYETFDTLRESIDYVYDITDLSEYDSISIYAVDRFADFMNQNINAFILINILDNHELLIMWDQRLLEQTMNLTDIIDKIDSNESMKS